MSTDNDRQWLALVVDEFLPKFVEDLKSSLPGSVDLAFSQSVDDPDFARHLPDAEILVTSELTAMDASRAQRLRLLHAAGAGLDSLAIDALPSGVSVLAAGQHGRSIAEFVLLSVLSLERRFVERDRQMREGIWDRVNRSRETMSRSLAGLKVGIVGYGEIGQTVSSLMARNGMEVAAVRRTPEPLDADSELSWCGPVDDLPQLAGWADFLVVAVPLTPQTRGLVDQKVLEAIGPRSYLVNVARGSVVDEADLFHALTNGVIHGAALDVWYEYPAPGTRNGPVSRFPFGDLPNVIMSPHCSGITVDTFRSRAQQISSNIAQFVAGAGGPAESFGSAPGAVQIQDPR